MPRKMDWFIWRFLPRAPIIFKSAFWTWLEAFTSRFRRKKSTLMTRSPGRGFQRVIFRHFRIPIWRIEWIFLEVKSKVKIHVVTKFIKELNLRRFLCFLCQKFLSDFRGIICGSKEKSPILVMRKFALKLNSRGWSLWISSIGKVVFAFGLRFGLLLV